MFPKDAQGTITQDTLRGILSDQGIEITKEDLQSMFNLMDKNKDGKLDLKDFAQYQDCWNSDIINKVFYVVSKIYRLALLYNIWIF